MKITDEEILKYDNVPVSIAAKYLGVGQMYIRIGLRRNNGVIMLDQDY